MKGGIKVFIIIILVAIMFFLLTSSNGWQKDIIKGKIETLITPRVMLEKINVWWGILQNNFYHRCHDSIIELCQDKTLKSIRQLLSQKALQEVKDFSQEKLQKH